MFPSFCPISVTNLSVNNRLVASCLFSYPITKHNGIYYGLIISKLVDSLCVTSSRFIRLTIWRKLSSLTIIISVSISNTSGKICLSINIYSLLIPPEAYDCFTRKSCNFWNLKEMSSQTWFISSTVCVAFFLKVNVNRNARMRIV